VPPPPPRFVLCDDMGELEKIWGKMIFLGFLASDRMALARGEMCVLVEVEAIF
jgi:hypothetical protein